MAVEQARVKDSRVSPALRALVGCRVVVESRVLGLHGAEEALSDRVLENVAHQLELLGEPRRVLEGELGRADFMAEDVNVLSELVDGIDWMLDVKEQVYQLVID